MGIPCALHESNASPGLAIKRLHRRADRVWLHFEETAKKLSSKKNVLCVGNPLRAQFGAMTKEEARNRLGISKKCFFILSFGGSIGAQAVDRAILELMSSFSSKTEDVIHIHAAGKRGIDQFLNQMRDKGLEGSNNCIAKDYIYDMPLQMAAAELVICRAGAMTLSELAKLKKAAILIPSPNVTDNHQYFNAKLLSDANAAVQIGRASCRERV